MSEIIIREEREEDYRATELMVMRAFWNIHGPGCNEHLFAHKLRESEDYLPQLSRVAELDGKIVGVIMYSKAQIIGEKETHDIITFGPLAVEPTLHSVGIGRKLLEETFRLAREQGYPGICIMGEPEYYPKHGFVTCDRFGITDMEGNNFDALMGYELYEGAFSDIKGKLKETDVIEQCEDEQEIDEFTEGFPQYKKLKLECQWIHKEKLGCILTVNENGYIVKFWELELPAVLSEDYEKEGKPIPKAGDYVTLDYCPKGESRILGVWQDV